STWAAPSSKTFLEYPAVSFARACQPRDSTPKLSIARVTPSCPTFWASSKPLIMARHLAALLWAVSLEKLPVRRAVRKIYAVQQRMQDHFAVHKSRDPEA